MTDEDDLRDRMHGATDTLVVDPARIRTSAARGGRRRRRVRGLAAGGLAASVVLVLAVSAQTLGGGGSRSTDEYVDRPGPPQSRSDIGNVTVTRGAGGMFTVKGGLAPRAIEGSRIELWAGRRGEPLTERTEYAPRPGIGVFGRRFRLAPGIWNIQLRYVYDEGVVDTGTYSTAIVLRERPLS